MVDEITVIDEMEILDITLNQDGTLGMRFRIIKSHTEDTDPTPRESTSNSPEKKEEP